MVKDTIPVYTRPFRLSPEEQGEVDVQVEDWLRRGIIRKSRSEYSSPVVVARKHDGSPRVCINFKKLNNKVEKQHFPAPLIEDVLDDLAEATVFCTIDMRDRFFHVEVDEESKKFLSFITPTGQLEFKFVPFGFCNSPPVFSEFVAYVFRPFIQAKKMRIYTDDGIIMA